MMYEHIGADKKPLGLQPQKIVCVGRNYVDHAKELNNPVPDEPLLFIKPGTAAANISPEFAIPSQQGEVHHELELALLIRSPLSAKQGAPLDEATLLQAVGGVGLALDLTLRDVQAALKKRGQPWEMAKAFDGSCPFSPFIFVDGIASDSQWTFRLEKNGEVQQRGNTQDMIFSIPVLLSYICQYFTLLPGDVVLTGTPAGVGPLVKGDRLACFLDGSVLAEGKVV